MVRTIWCFFTSSFDLLSCAAMSPVNGCPTPAPLKNIRPSSFDRQRAGMFEAGEQGIQFDAEPTTPVMPPEALDAEWF